MPSKPTNLREEIRSFIGQLSDPSSGMRKSAAHELAEFSDYMFPSERPEVMLALKTMILRGQEISDFVFGLYALGRVASGEMPTYVTSNIPFTKRDAVGIVFDGCSQDWVPERLPQDKIVKAGIKAINSIAGGSPEQVQCKLFEALSRKSETSRILALTSIFVFDIHTPEAIRKVALSTMDTNYNVRVRAEETFRKISRFGHPLRNIIMCRTSREARNAAELLFNTGHDTEPLKAFAVISFLRETEKGNELINLMLERNLLRETDIKKHEKEAQKGCFTSEMETRMERRKKQICSKIVGMQLGQGMGSRVCSAPTMRWRLGGRSTSSKPPQLHNRRISNPPRERPEKQLLS